MQKPDRRVARTQKALETALVDLLAEQDYQTITVEAICRRADVGRSAFYQHFAGKDDLFRAGFERLRRDLDEALAASPGGDEDTAILALCAAVFDHAGRHGKLYRAATSGHGGYIATRLIDGILTASLRQALAGNETPKAAVDLRAVMLANALLAALRWWFEHHNRPERDDMLALAGAILLGRPAPHTPPP